MAAVHAENDIKTLVVCIANNAANLVLYENPVPSGNFDRADIRRITGMPTAETRRIKADVCITPKFGQMPEHTFGQGRAADIAGANKKDRWNMRQGH